MEIPFYYSGTIDNQKLVGYQTELEQLTDSFLASKNIILTAPRKCGKTSLLERAASVAMDKDESIRICRIDFSKAKDMPSFHSLVIQEVLNSVESSWNEATDLLKVHFTGLNLNLSMGTGDITEMKVTVDPRDVESSRSLFWGFPARIAAEKGVRFVIIADNFGALADFTDRTILLTELFDNYNADSAVSYCMTGSRSALMREWFSSEPAKKAGFGHIISLAGVRRDEMASFIKSEFARTSKYIDDDACGKLLDLAGSNPYYIQQISQLAWLRTYVVCTCDIIAEAHASLLDQLDMHFKLLTETLTQQQLCYIKALICGETIVSTAEILYRYGITSATSASRSKSALLQRDITDIISGRTVLQDPLYAQWLSERYFCL